jgi:hypothetical protein
VLLVFLSRISRRPHSHQIQVQATGQGAPRPLVSPGWTINKYTLRGPSGRDDVKPGALLSGKYTSAFANDWLAPNPGFSPGEGLSGTPMWESAPELGR